MTKLNKETLIGYLKQAFESDVNGVEEPFGLLSITTSKEKILEVLAFLKTNKDLQFIYLTDITAVHYPEQALSIAVVYHVHSLVHNVRIRIKVFLDGTKPEIPSATSLWNGANWMERETYDFFGVIFQGHPDLRRILNVDEMEVFPMRKEYPLEDPNRVDKKDFFFGR
jgi:NADH-quinone oxidoreductase subunit C